MKDNRKRATDIVWKPQKKGENERKDNNCEHEIKQRGKKE
jgi:hypothetical protein